MSSKFLGLNLWVGDRRAVSNLKLFNKTLMVSYTSEFKTLAETANEDLGWLTGIEPATFRATV